jgi:phospholipid-transporting ATPase
MVSAVKDIFEDLKRHRADGVENSRKVIKSNHETHHFVEDQWKNLRVGHIVQIKADEYFPADLVLIKSSNQSGLCYIETKNLDGETNLKHKAAVKEIQGYIKSADDATNL